MWQEQSASKRRKGMTVAREGLENIDEDEDAPLPPTPTALIPPHLLFSEAESIDSSEEYDALPSHPF